MNEYPLTTIITGSSSGIGLEIARALLHDGANVVLNGRDPEKLA
jgi:NAD(P)-dependent dehydrogenase (short-subunit alcohol dehydrogenase family)